MGRPPTGAGRLRAGRRCLWTVSRAGAGRTRRCKWPRGVPAGTIQRTVRSNASHLVRARLPGTGRRDAANHPLREADARIRRGIKIRAARGISREDAKKTKKPLFVAGASWREAWDLLSPDFTSFST